MTQPQICIERTYLNTTLDDVWALWTTIGGIESWWGPEGFSVKVHSLDLKPGGELRYAMSATGPEQIEFMKNANMQVTTEAKITFVQVEPKTRLTYRHLTGFIPNVPAYDVTTLVELFESGTGGVRLLLTIDRMHDDVWTQRAKMGWESQLGKLLTVTERKRP